MNDGRARMGSMVVWVVTVCVSMGLAVSVGSGCGDDGGATDAGGGGRDGAMSRDGAMPPSDGGARVDGGGADVDGGTVALAEVHFLGRFERVAADDVRFAWPGSAIRARFDGTEIAVTLEDTGQNFFDVAIDGAVVDVLQPMSGSDTYTLASGLAAGEHELVLTRRTESFFGVTRFVGLSGATLVPSPAPTRFIEMIGDSITCGYGVLGAGPGCAFSADTEAETHAWGALAAADLEAAHVAIAYSGKGVIRNYGGDTTDPLPAIYDRMYADDPSTPYGFGDYSPDVVVVNLGTNDYSVGDPGTAFEDALSSFVGTIRGRHPDAWILLATSPMLGGGDHAAHRAHLDAVATGLADDRVALVDVAEQRAADGYGCDYHPSEPTQRLMADALVARIRELAGW